MRGAIAGVSLSLAMARDDQLDDAVHRALAEVAALAGADRAYVTSFRTDGLFSNTHEWCAPGIESHRSAIIDLQADDFAYSGGLALRGEVLKINDLEDWPPEAANERQSFARYGVHAVLEAPMFADGHLRGIIGFNHVGSALVWSDSNVELVRAMGDAIAAVLVRRDAAEAVRAARDAAEQANRAKDVFLSLVSHELRTPLHAILGFAELLRLDVRTPNEQVALERIVASGQQLHQLLEDLLDFSRVAAGELDLDIEPVDVSAVVSSAVAGSISAARTAGMRVETSIDDPGFVARADAARLGQVFDILLSSAVQHGRSGGSVAVAVRWVDGPSGGEQRTVEVSVSDDGPGVSSDVLAGMLDPFEPLGSEHHALAGTGIRLSIGRSLVEAMGGTLELHSVLGRGMSAVVRLPAAG